MIFLPYYNPHEIEQTDAVRRLFLSKYFKTLIPRGPRILQLFLLSVFVIETLGTTLLISFIKLSNTDFKIGQTLLNTRQVTQHVMRVLYSRTIIILCNAYNVFY